jgi:gas vesicle protein
MNLNALTRSFNRNVLIFKKQSPHIFFIGGIVGTVASTALACRATLKLSESLDKIKQDVDNLHSLKEDTNYPHDQYQKDLAVVYGRAALDITKLYAPSVIVGVASITALTSSHVTLAKRNTALMAAYSAVQEAYTNYRDRVRSELGEEKELDIYHATELQTVENGEGKKEVVKVSDPNKYSPYARFFDEVSPNWRKDPELNKLFIQCQQNYGNQLLQARGHLFLNEVYDMLGIDRSKAGAVVGWVIGKEGDNFVDFGIYEAFNSRFVNGWERSILLDFNVDGVIYDKI